MARSSRASERWLNRLGRSSDSPIVNSLLLLLSALAADGLAQIDGPEDLILPYQKLPERNAALREADEAMLQDYLSRSQSVVIGTVIAIRPDVTAAGNLQIASVLIEERLRGSAVGVVDFSVPLDRRDGRINPTLIEGYRLLVFLDASNALVAGDGLFFVEGGFAWRNRRENIFFRPSVDRVWVDEIDPTQDYITLSIEAIRSSAVEPVKKRGWRRDRV